MITYVEQVDEMGRSFNKVDSPQADELRCDFCALLCRRVHTGKHHLFTATGPRQALEPATSNGVDLDVPFATS